VADAFFLLFNTQTMHNKSFYTQQHCYVFPKNLIPWRDLNPGLLVPEADAMSTAPRRQGNKTLLLKRVICLPGCPMNKQQKKETANIWSAIDFCLQELSLCFFFPPADCHSTEINWKAEMRLMTTIWAVSTRFYFISAKANSGSTEIGR
jgi:hypothetical protein